jgi:FAD synthase
MDLPRTFSGEVVHGFGRGHKMFGFATANISPPSWAAAVGEDDHGVYAGLVWMREEPARVCVISLGLNLTFEVKVPTFEVHILDFDEDIYGLTVKVEIRHRIRSMQLFDCLDKLKKQIAADIETARQLVGTEREESSIH